MKFKSVDQALRFAFEISGASIVKTAKLEMDEVHSTASAGMSPQERHGQAALIIRAADRLLPNDCQLYVLCRYLYDPIGQTLAVNELAKQYIVPALGIKNTQMGVDLASRYFIFDGKKRDSRYKIANRHGVHHSTSKYWEDKIAAHIASITARAEGILWDEFTKNGLIDA